MMTPSPTGSLTTRPSPNTAMRSSRLAALAALLFALTAAAVDPAPTPPAAVAEPTLPDGTDAARKQIPTFRTPAGRFHAGAG